MSGAISILSNAKVVLERLWINGHLTTALLALLIGWRVTCDTLCNTRKVVLVGRHSVSKAHRAITTGHTLMQHAERLVLPDTLLRVR